MKLVGVQTEIKKIDVEVTDKELIKALKARAGLANFTLNEDETELGHWRDLSSERSNFEDLRWYCGSKDKGLIEVFKAIKVLESYILKAKE